MPRAIKNKKLIEQITEDITGKIPPQDTDIEEAILGAIMLDKEACHLIIDNLRPEHFYKEQHQKIYEAILSLYNKMEQVDILTVKDELQKRKELEEVGGLTYLSKLTNKIASTAHVELHSKILIQKYLLRELIRIANEIQRKAYNDEEDVYDLIDYSQNEIFNLTTGNIKRDAMPLSELIGDAVTQIKEASKHETKLSGIPSGFIDIDRITGGWQNSDLIIVAARPSMGKTSFVISMARNMALEHNIAVGIFSLEMSSIQLVHRLLSMETEIPSSKIRNGDLNNDEWERILNKINILEKAKIFIDDTPAISIATLRAKSRRLVSQQNVKLIIIDYLQLMTVGGSEKSNMTREQEVSTISRSLKALARDLNIPVIALSQLNRAVETRGGLNKKPQLSDLRDSGAIEQDADLVIFIHRPEKYIDQTEDGLPTKGLAQIIIAKHRNGPTAEVNLKFIESYAKFVDFQNINTDHEIITLQSRMNNSNDNSSF
ncbi:MAG: replicative DNA helicase [Bacteroidales bacterium]|nr:replicative DNA helicase [Bacteroidales bacterium]